MCIIRSGKVPWTPFFDLIFGKDAAYEGLADFDIISDFYGPELIRTGIPTITRIQGRDDVPADLGSFIILHGITPETETTTHYFGFSTRNFRQGDEELDNFQLQSELQVRQQDVDTINAVEKRLDTAVLFQRELLVFADKPAVQARRKIEAMLAAENTTAET